MTAGTAVGFMATGCILLVAIVVAYGLRRGCQNGESSASDHPASLIGLATAVSGPTLDLGQISGDR
jgi:hypothetical protein